MEAALAVWLISLLDPLTNILRAITVLLGVLFIIYFCSEKEKENLHMLPKKWVLIFILSGAGWLLLPSTQTGYVMAGAYFGQFIVQNEESKKVYDLIIKKIEKDLEGEE